ncbi:hypothetical protein TNCV_851471 [Trichonephila clavipes]|nr:hypothetical protein TNCV_851471 [Trichonephila clavipes]
MELRLSSCFRAMGSLVVRASDSRLEGLGGVAIYRPFGEFRRADSYCHMYGGQRRQAYFLPLATMNFMGFDLTTSGMWH